MLVTLLVLLLSGEFLCQYITHPLGAISYISKSHFQQAIGYNYITPSGQTVNVKFGASVTPPRAQTSAVPQFSAPRFVFHSAPVALPLTTNPELPEFSIFQPQQAQAGVSSFQQDFGPTLPTPESLFAPSHGVGAVSSEKQLVAYNDYLKEIAQEDARAVTTEAQLPDEYQPESLAYINVDIGEK